tara:strand:+ start:554 stop:814 length:261 start_codon:yes stop_codon:yes gene_type:complete
MKKYFIIATASISALFLAWSFYSSAPKENLEEQFTKKSLPIEKAKTRKTKDTEFSEQVKRTLNKLKQIGNKTLEEKKPLLLDLMLS